MNYSKEIMEKDINKLPVRVKKCLKYTIKLIEAERYQNGEFASIEDFITRMLKRNLDIHSFSVLAEYIPIKFPHNGDATMLRPMLALMGYDPDYSAAPDIKTYPLTHWVDTDDLPFN